MAIICSCLITYRPLLRWCVKTVTGKSQVSTGDESASPSEKKVWAKKLSPYDSDYTLSQGSGSERSVSASAV